MFTPKSMHGSGSVAVSYRQADNYMQTYRNGDRGDFANKFFGKLAGILNVGEFTDGKFAAVLDGNFGAAEGLKVKRGAYKKGEAKDDKQTQSARIGVELNYAGAKSTSVQGLLFDDVVCIEAHQAACMAANKYIEDNLLEFRLNIREIQELQARGIKIPEFRLIDKKLGTCRVKADNMLLVECLHTVSRFNVEKDAGGDPQVHSHDTAGTHTFMLGKLRSIEFGRVYDNQHLVDAIYKTAHRQYLEAHDKAFVDTKDGFELAGFTRNDVETFSDGRCDRIPGFIDEQNRLRADPGHPQFGEFLDIKNAKHREFANMATRGAKSEFDFSEHEDGAEHDDHSHSDPSLSLAAAKAWWTHKAANPAGEKRVAVDVNELRARVEKAQEFGRKNPTAKRTAEQAYALAIEHLTDRQSSIKSRETLLLHMLKFGLYQLSPDVLEEKIEEKIRAGELLLRDDGTKFTTRERVMTELRTASLFKERVGAVKPVTSKKMFDEKLAQYQAKKGFNLSAGQVTAARGVLQSTSGVSIIIGRAGTGKSTAVELIKIIAEAEGRRIFGLAPSGKAKEALLDSIGDKAGAEKHTDEGYKPDVITSQKAALSSKWWEDNCKPGSIVVLDEAGLVDADAMKKIMGFAAEHEVRLVLSGDYDQFHSVGAGAALHQLSELAKSVPAADALYELTEMQRGKDADTRELHDAAFKDPAAALVLMHEKGRLALIDDQTECLEAMAQQYSEIEEGARDNTFVITSRNATRRQLNDAIRTKLDLDSKPGLEFDAYERFGNMTGADLKSAGNFEAGMTVYFNKTVAPFQKGEACEVLGVEGHTVKLARKIIDAEGERFETIDFDPMTQADGASLGEQERIKVCVGERVRFTAESKKLGVSNGDRGVVESLDFEKRTARIRITDSGKTVTVPLPERSKGLSIRYGYAATGCSSQGGTAKNGGEVMMYAPAEHGTSYNEMYTNVTRSVKGSKSFRLYTDARGADAVNDLMTKAGKKLVHDRALETVGSKEPRPVPKMAFTAADGWTNRIEVSQAQAKQGLLEQIKEARKIIGPEIGLHGPKAWVRMVVKLSIENNLDVRVTNTGHGIQAYQTGLLDARKAAEKTMVPTVAKDGGREHADAVHDAVEDASGPVVPDAREVAQEAAEVLEVPEVEAEPERRPRPSPHQDYEYEG